MSSKNYQQLFPNISTKKLQLSDRNGGSYTLPNWQRYETRPIEVAIVRPDSEDPLRSWSRLDVSNISLRAALSLVYDTATPIAETTVWDKVESLNVFRGDFVLNTAAVNTAIGSETSIEVLFEIEMIEGTSRVKLYTATTTLAQGVLQPTTTSPDPTREYFDKWESLGQFLRPRNDPGQTLTLVSPNSNHEVTYGIDDNGQETTYIF